jgi:DNA-binding transcriptional regulator YiaG
VPNLAGVLKGEIRRLARKEVRATVMPLRKLVTTMRRRIAQQRKLLSELERASKRSVNNARASEAPASEGTQIRFSPEWVKAHRKRVKMSRREYAKLIGVSAQSIFGWESGRTRPRRRALESWRRIRTMGLRELKAAEGAKPAKRGRRAKPGRKAKKTRRAKPVRRARRVKATRRAKKK